MSDSLQPPGLHHIRLPCPSPTLWAYSDSYLLSWWCHPTILYSVVLSHPAFDLSQHQGLFQFVSSLHQVAKVWELQLQPQSSNDYSGLIFFMIDWFDLLAVQWTLKSLLQNHSSKASILQFSAFFMVQLSYPYMATEKPYLWPSSSLLSNFENYRSKKWKIRLSSKWTEVWRSLSSERFPWQRERTISKIIKRKI